MEKYKLKNNRLQCRYQFDIDGRRIALVDYIRQGDVFLLTHTEVPVALEGRGIGHQLVRAVLEDIRRKGCRVVPMCSFVSHFIRCNPEYEALLVRDKEPVP